ncbi:hypothetical protein Tco_0132584 [Tanacetum coccineum]
MAGIVDRSAGSPLEPVNLHYGLKMAFRNFIVAENDKNMSFIMKNPNEGSFEVGSLSVSVNINGVEAIPAELVVSA